MKHAMRTIVLSCLLMLAAGLVAQTYTHATVGQQSTYTGNCMVTTCSGTYYDNGGAAGNYSANINNIFRTFCPSTPGMCMRATFTQFTMNDTYFLCFGPNSCCDYLSILNGPVQNSPALWSNCTTSPGTITANNASGCLTFRFVSDGSVQLAGWTATLSCVPCAIGPSGTTNSDCAYATPVCADTPFSDASTGPGIAAEGCSGCVTSENYTNWYRIQIQTSGTLAFTINPNNNADDFDPVVFGPNVTCGSLGTPVRCSYAINAGNGNTGLGNGAADASEDVYGDQWVSQMNVTAGQIYYVMINGWSANSGSNGFLLDWTGTASLNCVFLPVEMLYVRNTCESGRSILEWATGSEVNSSHFLVDRSVDGTDWKEVGRVNSVHHSTQETEYLFVDDGSGAKEGGYYRLRQVDLDGRVTESKVVPMERCSSDEPWLTIAPNPTHDGVRVMLDASVVFGESASIELLDATGRPIHFQRAALGVGRNTIDMDLGAVAPGNYLLVLKQANGTVVQRANVVKQ
ncbi:MAG: T9SS type A sorting domain-containing protein [Flavobacteriales bacterium]|nr:T9SS type A sorting domain-containing protein [Flavobacteriales bacterium]